jgi:hypothetical protein
MKTVEEIHSLARILNVKGIEFYSMQVRDYNGSALQFSRESALAFDRDDTILPQMNRDLRKMVEKSEKRKAWKAVDIQDRIEKEWARISAVIDIPFPFIVYGCWFPATGQTGYHPDVPESGKIVFINPFEMITLKAGDPGYGIAQDDLPLFVFTHELRHLEQLKTGRLTKDSFDGQPLERFELKGRTKEDYQTYLNLPHEVDANTTAEKIMRTIEHHRMHVD